MNDPFISALRAVVHPVLHIPLKANQYVNLEEKQPATLNLLTLNCSGCGDIFAFTLDVKKGGQHQPLSLHTSKAATAKWNKVCDGVVVWRAKDGALRILVCDLKSSTPTGSEWKYQLWSSACFVKYLMEITRRFNADLPLEPNPKFHAVTFHGINHFPGRNKRRTAIQPGAGYPRNNLDDPQRMPVPNGAKLMLQALCN